MPRNTDIENLMTTMMLKLMPVASKGPNHELWAAYEMLQAWKLDVEWNQHGIGAHPSAVTTNAILKRLKHLPDRKLAQEIERVVRRHMPVTLQKKVSHAACGRITGDWTGHPGKPPTRGKPALKASLAERRHPAVPAAAAR